MTRSHRSSPDKLVRIGAGLLLLAHLVTIVALIRFGIQVNALPLSAMGLIVYTLGTGAAAFGLITYIGRPGSTFQNLMLLSAPLLLGIVFWSTFSGPYAPYDHHDSDLVQMYYVLFAICFISIAVLYASQRYLVVGWMIQVVLYFGTYTLPPYIQQPGSHILGAWPSIFFLLTGLYLVGIVLLGLRQRILGARIPRLEYAAVLLTVLGARFLYEMLTWLPRNGSYLGYYDGTPLQFLPAQAWNWTRTTAEYLTLIAFVASILGMVWIVLHSLFTYVDRHVTHKV